MIIEQSPDEIAAKLALMSDELGHSVLDIRERAIASLNFKLSNDLLTFKDVGSHSGVLRALLDWFGHEDSVPGDERALAMLRRIVEEEPTAAARLQNLGAEAALLEVTDGASRQLAAQIESLVEKIATGGADVAPQEPPSSPPGPDPETANVDVPEADEKDDAEEAAEEPPAEEAAEAEDSTEVEDLKQEDSKEDAPAEEEDGPADEEDAPADEEDTPADEEEETAEEDNAEAAAVAPDDDDPAFIRLDPALKDMFRKNPRLATAYWNIVRTHGLESESNRAAAVAAVGDSRTLETATRGGSLHLRRVGISPRDDARLLELSVRLRHADDPCLLTAALTEFTDCALKDLPPQALLQRPRCLWAVISLARAREGPTAAHNARRATRGGSPIAPAAVRAAALAALRDFVVAIKGALGHANDGAHAVRLAPTTTSTDPDDVEDLLLGGAREHSYPPPVPCSDDDDDDDDDVPGRDPLHALPVAHLLAVSVVPLLAEPAVAGDALLVLQETLPLLELTPADRGDDADAAAVVDVEAVATRLGTYATAMERALATASAGASASGEDELLPTGECPAFFPALAMTAVMLAAAGADAAAIATRRGTIPARLVTRVETAAIDELLAAAVPGLRKVTLAALDVLGRPSSAAERGGGGCRARDARRGGRGEGRRRRRRVAVPQRRREDDDGGAPGAGLYRRGRVGTPRRSARRDAPHRHGVRYGGGARGCRERRRRLRGAEASGRRRRGREVGDVGAPAARLPSGSSRRVRGSGGGGGDRHGGGGGRRGGGGVRGGARRDGRPRGDGRDRLRRPRRSGYPAQRGQVPRRRRVRIRRPRG